MARWSLLAAASSAAIAGVALAGPASASTTYTVSFQCSFFGLTASPSSVTAAVNDVVRMNVVSPGNFTVTSVGATGPASISSAGTYDYTVTQANGSLTFLASSGACAGQSLTVAINGGGGGAPAEGASAPAPVVQEFGLPASGTCDAAASNDLNWAGVASGGWSISWAEWMNGGQGGAVCTRTLFYDTNAAAWAVQA